MPDISLLHFDGADTSTTIDDSGGAYTWTAQGDAQLDTTTKKFDSASLQLDAGTSPQDGIFSDAVGASALGGGVNGPWTLDFWLYLANVDTSGQTLLNYKKISEAYGIRIFHQFGGGNRRIYCELSANGTSNFRTMQGTIEVANTAQWYHFAVTYDDVAETYYTYVDGVKNAEWASTTEVYNGTDSAFYLGYWEGIGQEIDGFIDELYITQTCRYPGGTGFTPETAAYPNPPGEGNAALVLPTKALTAVGAAPGSRIVLPKKVAYGPFNGGAIILPPFTVAGVGLKAASAYIVLPSKTLAAIGGSGDNLSATIPEFTTSFTAYVGGSMRANIQTPWLDLLVEGLLGSTATVDATTDLFLAGFSAVQGPFGLDATIPLAQASMSAVAGTTATLTVQAPQLVVRITGEGVYSATFAALTPLPIAGFVALRGASATVTMKLPLPKVEVTAEMTSEATVAMLMPVVTSAFAGYTQASATFAMVLSEMEAALDADSQFVFNQTLVVNANTHAASEYANYAFNSFCDFNGAYYAADSSGVYALDTGGVDDGSAEIPANITTGDLDFANEFQKRVPDIYAALRADGDMTVSVSMDEQTTYQYTLTTHGVTRLKQRRVKIGKGVKGKYCRVGVANVSGADFDLDTLNITATLSKNRRI